MVYEGCSYTEDVRERSAERIFGYNGGGEKHDGGEHYIMRKPQVVVILIVMPPLYPEDGRSMTLRNVNIQHIPNLHRREDPKSRIRFIIYILLLIEEGSYGRYT
jgi:hypothetical protein